jgi:hypothetical protein
VRFRLDSDTAVNFAGLSTTFQVRFTPDASGTRSATVTVASDDGDGEQLQLRRPGDR